MILFLNEQFNQSGENTPPPVVKVSECLNLTNLKSCLKRQLGPKAWNCVDVGEFYACSLQTDNHTTMVPVKALYSDEQEEVKRFCDEIDSYQKHQCLNYNCQFLESQIFKGAPIICRHGGSSTLVGISSTGKRMVTLHGICQLLAGTVYNSFLNWPTLKVFLMEL